MVTDRAQVSVDVTIDAGAKSFMGWSADKEGSLYAPSRKTRPGARARPRAGRRFEPPDALAPNHLRRGQKNITAPRMLSASHTVKCGPIG